MHGGFTYADSVMGGSPNGVFQHFKARATLVQRAEVSELLAEIANTGQTGDEVFPDGRHDRRASRT